jgi:hypothetical protein
MVLPRRSLPCTWVFDSEFLIDGSDAIFYFARERFGLQ